MALTASDACAYKRAPPPTMAAMVMCLVGTQHIGYDDDAQSYRSRPTHLRVTTGLLLSTTRGTVGLACVVARTCTQAILPPDADVMLAGFMSVLAFVYVAKFRAGRRNVTRTSAVVGPNAKITVRFHHCPAANANLNYNPPMLMCQLG